jgi:hypothetical protein
MLSYKITAFIFAELDKILILKAILAFCFAIAGNNEDNINTNK